MNYAELAVMQASRAKTFSAAQTDAMAAYCQAEHDLKELQAENAKLRELVRELYEGFVLGYVNGMSEGEQQRIIAGVVERYHELGIEVDA